MVVVDVVDLPPARNLTVALAVLPGGLNWLLDHRPNVHSTQYRPLFLVSSPEPEAATLARTLPPEGVLELLGPHLRRPSP